VNTTNSAHNYNLVETKGNNRFAVQPWSTLQDTASGKQNRTTNASKLGKNKTPAVVAAVGKSVAVSVSDSARLVSDICDEEDEECCSLFSDVSEEELKPALLATEHWHSHAGSGAAAEEWLGDEGCEADMPQHGIEASASILTLDSNLDEAFLQLFSN
jgi:hypothetical protein